MHPLLRSKIALAGVVVLVLGCAPLAAVAAAEALGFVQGSNPVGLGLLFLASVPTGSILIGVGSLCGAAGRARGRGGAAAPARPAPRRRAAPVPGRDPSGPLLVVLRVLAALVGLALVALGITSLRRGGGRGAAGTIVLGLAIAGFGIRGGVPRWFSAQR